MAWCDEMRLLIGPFDDGELEPHEMEEVAFHVVACVGCKAALETYRALGVGLREVVTAPALDHFAAQVAARIDHSWIPLHTRFRRLWDLIGSLGSVFEIAVVAAATAAITVIVVAPQARQLIAQATPAPRPAAPFVQTEPKAPIATANNAALPAVDLPEDVAMHESQELVSQLGGGDSPSVAVWNEPQTGTTVVWVPDQP